MRIRLALPAVAAAVYAVRAVAAQAGARAETARENLFVAGYRAGVDSTSHYVRSTATL